MDDDRRQDAARRWASRRRRRRRRRSPSRCRNCSPATSSTTTVTRPEIDAGARRQRDRRQTKCRDSIFLPEGTKWLDEATVSSALGRSADRPPHASPGVHGLGLLGGSDRRHRTRSRSDQLGRQRRHARSRSPGPKPGRIDRERDHRGRSPSTVAIRAGSRSLESGVGETRGGPAHRRRRKARQTLEVEVEPVPGEKSHRE